MKPSRIVAVEHVHLESQRGLAEHLIWFYTQVGCLEHVMERDPSEVDLCFRSARLEVRFHFVDNPAIDAVARRLTLIVPSLADAAELLDERRTDYLEYRGLEFTDQRLSLLDPGGHRVELRQQWGLL